MALREFKTAKTIIELLKDETNSNALNSDLEKTTSGNWRKVY